MVGQTSGRGVGERARLTSIDWLLGLLGLGAGVVCVGGLGLEAGRGAVPVQVAATVHCLLEGVAFPPKDVVTVGSSASVRLGGGQRGPDTPRNRFVTHPMPMLYVNGLEPSVGQMLRSFWNIVMFHMSSYMICGSFTG